jgi:Fur family ferric uptake transcriptional regulator
MTHGNSAEKLLKHHSIRNTGCREVIIQEFYRHPHALSQPDLEKAIGEDFDRVTIYRTLTLFLEKGILHKVPDDSGATKYALCPEDCSETAHHHEHVHFKCNQCGMTQCLDHVHIPKVPLPAGFTLLETNLLVHGVCKQCNLMVNG